MLSIPASQLVALFAQAILYGIYLVTVGAFLVPFPRKISVMISVVLVLFVLSTTNLAFGLVRVLRPNFQSPPSATGQIARHWVDIAKVGVQCSLSQEVAQCSTCSTPLATA
jgi:hypothetical protein